MRSIVLVLGLLLPVLVPIGGEVPTADQFNPCNPRVQQCG
jgi:hypothetical protein